MVNRLARIRGLMVALVVLSLSAGAVLAGGDGPPAAADHGLGIATERSGMSVPVAFNQPEVDEETDENATEEQSEETDENADTHGALVSGAAQMETPDGFDNHGAFVSCVARMNRGQLGPDFDPATVDLSGLTPDDCDRTDVEATSTEPGPGKSAPAKAKHGTKGAHGRSPNH